VTPSRRAREAGAILLLGLALVMPSARAAWAEVPEAGETRRCLEQAGAALEGEAALLEVLAAGPGLGSPDGVIDLAGYLADVEVRLWQLQVTAGEVRAWALPADWQAYEHTLLRVVELQSRLAERVASRAAGLPAPGRTCPVDGPVDFSPTWGEERPWGRSHKGADLHADAGTPLVAVESGTVLQSGWHWQGGFGVWLAGYYSGDVYYYAHLSWIAPGIRVGAAIEVGDLLGGVGSTGNATSPHLHFGWIPGEAGDWADLTGLADPYPLLAGLCR
jgi:murein DD-endopeptidase MepM/ murein hydrolase activator NlpD